MYWQDETKGPERFVVPDDVVDLAFAISCRALPVDHAWALSQAVLAELPWMMHEAGAGVHTVHMAESGNGWLRPDHADDLLYLSHRTRLVLRLPKQRLEAARLLSGKTLDVAGYPLQVEKDRVRPLTAISTVFARYILSEEGDENTFLEAMRQGLETLGIKPRKMLCGIERTIVTPERPLRTRSLMLAELAPEESVLLQQRGLGPGRRLGCGLFLPHKDIKHVAPVLD
jgi:CRISPR-associated protein Cas6